MRTSTSGSGTARSILTQNVAATALAARHPDVQPEAQPHTVARDSGSSSRTSVTVRAAAPRQSVRPPLAGRDEGTRTAIASRLSADTAAASQNTRW
ncbi:hypothetical protein [Streptomyces sp900116325]|uniref:hypothetical protein n=1 Tax=Streptomyces sp. 900116325 TaxID=3154295 RepID=UPI0033BDEA0F